MSRQLLVWSIQAASIAWSGWLLLAEESLFSLVFCRAALSLSLCVGKALWNAVIFHTSHLSHHTSIE